MIKLVIGTFLLILLIWFIRLLWKDYKTSNIKEKNRDGLHDAKVRLDKAQGDLEVLDVVERAEKAEKRVQKRLKDKTPNSDNSSPTDFDCGGGGD